MDRVYNDFKVLKSGERVKIYVIRTEKLNSGAIRKTFIGTNREYLENEFI